MESRGVLYVATGDKYHAEAAASSLSVRAANPDLPIAIATDRSRPGGAFTHEIIVPEPRFNMADKCSNLTRTPFRETLYLDSDTYVADDLTELFSLLEQFDFAGAHEVARGYWYRGREPVPDSFPEINGGVLLFRRNPVVDAFLELWVAEFWRTQEWLLKSSDGWQRHNDQVSLRLALWKSRDLRFTVLPTEYNALRHWGTYLWGKAKIVHAKGDAAKVAREMNEITDHERVYLQQFGVSWAPELMPLSRIVKGTVRHTAALFLSLLRRSAASARRRQIYKQ